MRKITAIIPTYNEESNLRKAIESVKWADEIMVVDSFSTDKTLEIAKEYTNFILQRTYENSASQKNWAIPQATHDWIFLLDADEVVTPALQKEVQEKLKDTNELADAYWIGRVNFFMNQRVNHVVKGDKVIRFFNKKCRYQPLKVHAEIITEGQNVEKLNGKLEHYTFKSIDLHLTKINRYADWAANDYLKKTPKVTYFHLCLKPLFRFFKHFILEKGFLDGRVGFVISSVFAWSVFLRYWKILDIQNQAKRKD